MDPFNYINLFLAEPTGQYEATVDTGYAISKTTHPSKEDLMQAMRPWAKFPVASYDCIARGESLTHRIFLSREHPLDSFRIFFETITLSYKEDRCVFRLSTHSPVETHVSQTYPDRQFLAHCLAHAFSAPGDFHASLFASHPDGKFSCVTIRTEQEQRTVIALSRIFDSFAAMQANTSNCPNFGDPLPK